MKLYPILFLGEAAKTADIALNKRLVAFETSKEKSPFKKIILLSD